MSQYSKTFKKLCVSRCMHLCTYICIYTCMHTCICVRTDVEKHKLIKLNRFYSKKKLKQ